MAIAPMDGLGSDGKDEMSKDLREKAKEDSPEGFAAFYQLLHKRPLPDKMFRVVKIVYDFKRLGKFGLEMLGRLK